MKCKLVKNQPILHKGRSRGRGAIQFPEFLDLRVSQDKETGDCLYYPDTPRNRELLRYAKHRYSNRDGAFKGRYFTMRCDIVDGEPTIIIQRIA